MTHADRGLILRLQLQAPLVCNLREAGLCSTTPACIPQGIRTFYDALTHPAAQLELLMLVKDFARQRHHDGSLPPEVAGAIYYLAIAAGLVRHGRLISTVSIMAVDRGLERIASADWVALPMRSIARDAWGMVRRHCL